MQPLLAKLTKVLRFGDKAHTDFARLKAFLKTHETDHSIGGDHITIQSELIDQQTLVYFFTPGGNLRGIHIRD